MIAIAIWFFRGGRGSKNASGQERPADLLDYLLPRDIYTHVSARVDITLYVFERLLRPLWATALILSVGTFAETQVIAGLNVVMGSGPALDTTYGWMLLYSLVTLLLYDFVFYVIHYTEHKVPALWVIHKVHHSAEVLTPLTRYREHFLEGPIYAAGAALAYGIAGGLFSWLLEADITQATLFNIGFFSLLFGFNGSFRHYHVAFHYPVWLSKWLQSPVMHHTHHSYLEKHWDTNLAAVTSIWDRLFGTLYIPEKDEYTPWGLGPETQDQYRGFWQNTVGPFKDWVSMLTGGSMRTNNPLAGGAARTDVNARER
ncbi:MAG: sterol desaturase family protein [Pseudomonadota bacterium]|nr:sterol desaturase family protein [Pseudomonadota bacterium]MEC8267407.1 sterol desaturase family protein [Pseudomonadota bacterium]MED5540094.1 sterol desaturase family protein [Pseudomonadota bacterium]